MPLLKLALIAAFTPVRSKAKKGRVHAFPLGDYDRTVCGRRARGWIVMPAITGIREVDMLTCTKCRGGCK